MASPSIQETEEQQKPFISLDSFHHVPVLSLSPATRAGNAALRLVNPGKVTRPDEKRVAGTPLLLL